MYKYRGPFSYSWFKRVVKAQDGSTYKTVKIGEQLWMTENLNVSIFRNGDLIPEAKTENEWKQASSEKKPVWCYYKNDPDNGRKYGKLYNWYAVCDSRRLAPEEWHIPKEMEWVELLRYIGRKGKGNAGNKMKSIEDWDIKNSGKKGGTNKTGFTALPGGKRGQICDFCNMLKIGYWWSSEREISQAATLNEYMGNIIQSSGREFTGKVGGIIDLSGLAASPTGEAFYFELNSISGEMKKTSEGDGLSVRCLKD
jgi:uncharacterized protein (TIGR02145 family)